eukprot:361308-Chlamydomonas_euryale.AAC.4
MQVGEARVLFFGFHHQLRANSLLAPNTRSTRIPRAYPIPSLLLEVHDVSAHSCHHRLLTTLCGTL